MTLAVYLGPGSRPPRRAPGAGAEAPSGGPARAERDAARADLARIDDALQAMVVHGAEATAQMHVERVERCAPEEYAGGVYY